jgi:hypothetical protein
MDWDHMERGIWYQIISNSDNYFFVIGDLLRIEDEDTVSIVSCIYDGTRSLDACIKNSAGAVAVRV